MRAKTLQMCSLPLPGFLDLPFERRWSSLCLKAGLGMFSFHFPHPSHAVSDYHHHCNPGIQETWENIRAGCIFQILNAFLSLFLWNRSRKKKNNEIIIFPHWISNNCRSKKKYEIYLFSLQLKYLSWPRKSIYLSNHILCQHHLSSCDNRYHNGW